MDETTRAAMLVELAPLSRTDLYRKLSAGTADAYEEQTAAYIARVFRTRSADFPDAVDAADREALREDTVRHERHERKAFAAGWIPPWLWIDLPALDVIRADGTRVTDEGVTPPQRDPDLLPGVEP